MTKIAESGSVSQRHGSADPNPHQNALDSKHCFKLNWIRWSLTWCFGSGLESMWWKDERTRKVRNKTLGSEPKKGNKEYRCVVCVWQYLKHFLATAVSRIHDSDLHDVYKIFCFLIFEGPFTVHHFSKIKSHKEITKQLESMFFLLFLLDRRILIREARKHMDPTDPDP